MRNTANIPVNKIRYESSKPPNNKNKYFITKNTKISIKGDERITLRVLKLIRKTSIIILYKVTYKNCP